MLESVKVRLRAQGRLSPEIERRILEFERICLAEIHSEALRYATLDYLKNQCPLEFFTAPASSSGRRHPEWQSLPGGILLNTVECCVGADKKIRMYSSLTTESDEPKDDVHDIVYVATLLSDTFKAADFGKPWKEWLHHIKAAEEWQRVAQKHEIPPPIADRISSAIRWHLGRFTPDWPAGRDPRAMDLLDFIVHELDMDFSNRRLSDVFQRRLGEVTKGISAEFVNKEFETAAFYFQHVEGKLNNLLVFFATLLVAVISACYYIGSSDMFKNLTFSRTPRASDGSATDRLHGDQSGLCWCVYGAARSQNPNAGRNGSNTRVPTGSSSSLWNRHQTRDYDGFDRRECPPYLRRPSEDWYTLLLMTISSASAFAVALPFWSFWIVNARGFQQTPHPY